MNGIEFIAHMDEKHRRQGFANRSEAFVTILNWKETFGTDLPEDYYHPRDYRKLIAAINDGALF